MHSPSRRRARARTRVLYWFRTPPNVKVGRAPLDEDAIKLIEEHHPHIRFDWPQILNGEEEVAYVPRAVERVDQPSQRAQHLAREARGEPVSAPPEPGSAAEPNELPDLPAEPPMNPAHAQLGSEGLARLRARFADVMAGISRRLTDPERAEQLRVSAERLNPDSWVTEDEVKRGLEEYEAVFESLRGSIGRRRRRRRRSNQHNRATAHDAATDSAGPGDGGLDEGVDERGQDDTGD